MLLYALKTIRIFLTCRITQKLVMLGTFHVSFFQARITQHLSIARETFMRKVTDEKVRISGHNGRFCRSIRC